MSERRLVPRPKTYLGGRAVFANRICTSDCIVRNLSPHGARLDFGDTVGLPAQFELALRRRGENRPAKVIWRTATAVGVAL